MAFKLNISDKQGKSWKIELADESLVGKSVGDKLAGKEVNANFEGYEFEITGGSDIAGFPMAKDVEGLGLKRVLLKKGWGMHKKPRRGGKKKSSQPAGLRLRKTVRGKIISASVAQLNLKVLKDGTKKLKEIFPEQNQPKVKGEKKVEAAAPVA